MFRNTLMLVLVAVTAAFSWIVYDHIWHCSVASNHFIPDTISKEAQLNLKTLYQIKFYDKQFPSPDDRDAWRILYQKTESDNAEKNIHAAALHHVSFNETTMGGVRVMDIHPQHSKDHHKILVYIHGGAYTMFSPLTTLVISAPISQAAEQRVIAIQYTTAPFADWQEIQNQVMNVFKALLAEGYAMKDIAVFGDSAGGGLAMNTVLNLRNSGMGMPAALVLLSPWADLTNRGDTAQTLANTDPILNYDHFLKNSALAYAHGLSLTDARVSPLYADFTKGFPPTLIIEGTKCTFLSTSVRTYQALTKARQPVHLEMYEGMWHDFLAMPMPESQEAIQKVAAFMNEHLHQGEQITHQFG